MKYLISTLVLCLSTASASQAQAPLTLDEAVTQGMAYSRHLAELQSRADAAGFEVAGQKAGDRPLVAAQGGYQRTNHVQEFAIVLPGGSRQVVYPDVPDNYRARIDLQWPIYDGGRTDALARAAEAERTAVGKDLDTARADLRLEITRAYYAVVTAREAESVLQRSLDAVNAQVADVRTRLESGLIPPNDLTQAQAQASHQRLLAVEASTQRAVAEADLRRLIGGSGPLVLAEVPPPPPASSPEEAALVAQALKARPERQALEQRASEADLRATAAAASLKPQVGVGGGYDYARPNPRIFPRKDEWNASWDASVNVTWSLWDSGRRAAATGEAKANAAALKTRIDDFDRQVTFEVQARSLELASSRQAVTAADDEVRAATETERAVGERYRSGVATTTDVLEAQVARLQADLDRTRAIADVRLAQARLERAIGR
jgi:outer membrane protein